MKKRKLAFPKWAGSKWKKTELLLANRAIGRCIPATRKFSSAELLRMLSKYGMVYMKPNRGSFGKGVIRLARTANGFSFQHGEKARHFSSFSAMQLALLRGIKGRRYLIQKGVQLLRHKGRRFDLRVMVQLDLQGKWVTTGIIGRLAHPRKIVTNYHSGGTPMAIERLLGSHASAARIAAVTRRLSVLGEQVAQQLASHSPALRAIGLDIGLDRTLKPQILEVNTKPDPYIFKKLKDKRVYRKVMRYARQNGFV